MYFKFTGHLLTFLGVVMAHRGVYGTEGGGGMYRSSMAGLSFLLQSLADSGD